uniref:Reverse transcriptase domain-containing protein n=1 Tax=Glossina palpalis gambiensis TaxID=67801 RepID=A0A1B0BY06_9MUSC
MSLRQCSLEIMHTRLVNLLDLKMNDKFIAAIGIRPRKLFGKKEENILSTFGVDEVNDHFVCESNFDLSVGIDPWKNLILYGPFSFACVSCHELNVVLHQIKSKSIEHILKNQILSAVMRLVSPSHVFRRGHSTTRILINLTDTIRINVKGSRMPSLVALDLSKAFNNVSHRVLVSWTV